MMTSGEIQVKAIRPKHPATTVTASHASHAMKLNPDLYVDKRSNTIGAMRCAMSIKEATPAFM
jgi:hypothetical protein